MFNRARGAAIFDRHPPHFSTALYRSAWSDKVFESILGSARQLAISSPT
jgi:hypothetical protein